MNRRDIVIGASAAVVGAAAGSAITYKVVKKKIEQRAFQHAEDEIEQVKEMYKLLRKEPPYDDPATAARAYMDRIGELQYYAEQGVEAAEEEADQRVEELSQQLAESLETQEEIREDASQVAEILEEQEYVSSHTVDDREAIRNIFNVAEQARLRRIAEEERAAEEALAPGDINPVTGERRDPDAFDELSTRDPKPPFVISMDEYFENEPEFTLITLTYFEGDQTLADDQEHEIPDLEGSVGAANLEQFGMDSGSADTVYIRNEKLRVQYEVIKDEGSFNHIVLGLQEMERHQAKSNTRVKRMRDNE